MYGGENANSFIFCVPGGTVGTVVMVHEDGVPCPVYTRCLVYPNIHGKLSTCHTLSVRKRVKSTKWGLVRLRRQQEVDVFLCRQEKSLACATEILFQPKKRRVLNWAYAIGLRSRSAPSYYHGYLCLPCLSRDSPYLL